MPPPVQLLSIATAVPPFCFEQRDVAAAAHRGLPSRTLVTAMGPGFTTTCAALKRAA